MIVYIYKTTNKINGKIYIGQKKSSKFLGNRYLGSGKKLKLAVQKYGKENFEVEMLESICDENKADEREIFWISHFKSTDDSIGYNISNGGNVNRAMSGKNNPHWGKHLSEETKEKLRQKAKLQMTEEARAYLSWINSGERNKRFGKKHTEKTKQLMRERAIERYKDPNERLLQSIRAQVSNANPETKKKLSESKKKLYSNPEERHKQSVRMRGRVYSNETLHKMSIAQLESYKKRPDLRMRISEQQKKRMSIPENREKIRNAVLGRRFVTNDIETKLVLSKDVDYYLSRGWHLGMKKRVKLEG